VSLARALIVRPNVLLLDEPLSNLDAHLRFEMRDLIRSLQREIGITMIFVTHDQEEAVVLADKVALILDGRLKQYDVPELFYRRPVDEATARFFGGQNFISGISKEGYFDSPLGKLNLPADAKSGHGALCFRSENVLLGAAANNENRLEAKITDSIYLGTHARLKLKVGDQQITAIANPDLVQDMAVGDTIAASLPASALWVLTS